MKFHAYCSATILLLVFFWVTLVIFPGIYAPSFFARSSQRALAVSVAQLPEAERGAFAKPANELTTTVERLEADEKRRNLGIPWVIFGLIISLAYVIRSERHMSIKSRG